MGLFSRKDKDIHAAPKAKESIEAGGLEEDQAGWVYVWSHSNEPSFVRVGHLQGKINDRNVYLARCHEEAIQYCSPKKVPHTIGDQKLHNAWPCKSNVSSLAQAVALHLDTNFTSYKNLNFLPSKQGNGKTQADGYKEWYEGDAEDIVRHVQLVHDYAKANGLLALPGFGSGLIEIPTYTSLPKLADFTGTNLPEIADIPTMQLNKLVQLIRQYELPIDITGDKRIKKVTRRIKAAMQEYLEMNASPPDYKSPLYPRLEPVSLCSLDTDHY